MRVVVTGAAGFVGQALVGALSDEHEVISLDQKLKGLPGIEGDLCDPAVLDRAFEKGCDAVVHLATVPGGATEANPNQARRINVEGSMRLIDAAMESGHTPRFIFASSIAVFGQPLPPFVDDMTPVSPKLLYGGHKAMMEQWIAMHTRRGGLSGLSLRLPGIVARPKSSSGLKSAFMSDVFHALQAGDEIELPVSQTATMWLMSVNALVKNLRHALTMDVTGTITLPALRVSMQELVRAIAQFSSVSESLAIYSSDRLLEEGFGAQPPLATPSADAMGFRHDASLEALVSSAFETL